MSVDPEVLRGRRAWKRAWGKLDRGRQRSIERVVRTGTMAGDLADAALAVGLARRWIRQGRPHAGSFLTALISKAVPHPRVAEAERLNLRYALQHLRRSDD